MAKIDSAIMLSPDDTEALGRVLHDSITTADADRSEYISTIEDNRDLIAAADEDEENLRWADSCPFNVPLLKIYRNAFLARLSRALLKHDPIHYFDGSDQISKQFEAQVEKFNYAQASKKLNLEWIWRNSIMASTLDDGTGAAYITWETRVLRKLHHVKRETMMVDPETGEVQIAAGDYETKFLPTVAYDGPVITPIPIEHVGVYPAGSLDAQRAQGVYVRVTKSGQELLDGMFAGKYDKKAVESLQAHPFDAVSHAKRDELEKRGISFSESSYNPMRDFQSLPFDLVEWYWFYQNPDLPNELQCDWLFVQEINTKTILRAIPNPWGHGMRPVVFSHVFPPKYGIIGDGLADYAGKFQKFFSWMLRGMVDGMDGRIDPELALGSGINDDMLNKFRENRGPGQIHDFGSAEDLTKILQPIVLGMNPNEALPMLQFVQSMSDLSVQYQNAFGGRPAARQVTLGELEKMNEEGQEGVLDMVDSSSKALTEAGIIIHELNSQFSGRDSVRELWAMTNPEYAEEDVTQILAASYDIRAAGTTETSNRSVKKQRAIEMYGALKDSPLVQVDPTGKKIYQLTKDLITEGFGKRSAEPYIGTEEEAQMLPMAQETAKLLQVAQEMEAAAGEGEGGDEGMTGGEMTPPEGMMYE